MTGPTPGQIRTVMVFRIRRVRSDVSVVLEVFFHVSAGPAPQQPLVRSARIFAVVTVTRFAGVLLLNRFVFQKSAGEPRGGFAPGRIVVQVLTAAAGGRGFRFSGALVCRR